MPKLVISTIGTSLLTNQIDTKFERSYEDQLLATVNESEADIEKHHPEIQEILQKLAARAKEVLQGNKITKLRKASAELNGIYGLYANDLTQATGDAHLLIATDTAQGKLTAELLEAFLKKDGVGNTSVICNHGLSLKNAPIFSEGMAKLLDSLQPTIREYKERQYQICFNLVGGFKALQGFFSVIGMFYADEMVYIFEGSDELITIPKLPVKIDSAQVESHKVPLAMMNAGEIRASWEEAKKVPAEWVCLVDQEMTLSTWGQLVWNECKDEILKGELLKFPDLDYAGDFEKDYKNQMDVKERIALQETLAKITSILQVKKDGISTLKKDGGIQLDRYTNTTIDHFRASLGLRVSCKVLDGGKLSLRYYGTHDHVERKERVR